MDLFKTRDDVDEYNDLLAEVQQLRAIIGDQQILLDEHRMDNQHAYEEGGNAERAAVVAWLRGEPERLVECNGHRHADGKPCWVMSPMPAEELADAIERGEHRREEKD
jgi:hypothetical protein